MLCPWMRLAQRIVIGMAAEIMATIADTRPRPQIYSWHVSWLRVA